MEIETIREKTIEILRNHGEVLVAYLYGSFTRKEANEKSDMDIGLLLKDNFKPDPLYEAKLSIEFDKNLGVETEIRILNNREITFLHQVLKYGVLLFSRNERERIRFETDTYSRYLDFKPFYEGYNKIRQGRLLA